MPCLRGLLERLRLRRRPAGNDPGPARGPLPQAPRTSPVGTSAPVVAGVTPDGQLLALQPGEGVVLFLTSSCLACRTLWAALADGAPDADGVTVAAVVTPDALEDRRALAALAPPGIPVVMSTAAWQAYAAAGSPWVALLLGGLVAAEGPAEDWDDVVDLARGKGRRLRGAGDRPEPR